MSWWHWWLLAGVPWAFLATVSQKTWRKFGYYTLINALWVCTGPLSLPLIALDIWARRKL